MSQGFNPPYAPTRFPMGVGTANDVETLGNFGQPDPTKYQLLFDDFNFVANWTAVTTAIAAGPGGLATITAAGSIASAASWQLDMAKRQFLKVRASAAGATTVGLVGFVDALVPTTGMYVTFLNGLYTLTVGTATVSYQRAFAAAEFVEFGAVHNPDRNRVELYVDNELAATISDATLPVGTNLLLAASATTANATLDYIFAATER